MIRSRRRTRHPLEGPGIDGGFVPNWTPRQLGLRALYDYRSADATGFYDQSGNGRAQATVGGGSNSPLWLPYVAPQVYLPGTSNRITSNSGTSFDVTDLDVWGEISIDDWTPATIVTLIERQGGDPTRAFQLLLDTNGTVALKWFPTGSAASVITRTTSTSIETATGVTAGGAVAVRATLDVDDGAGNHVVTFYHRLGGFDGTWTLWQTITTAGTTSLPSVSRVIELGGSGAGAGTVPVAIRRARLHASIGGAVRADFNASLCGQSGYTDAVGSVGAAWTVARSTTGRKSVVQSPTANSGTGLFLFGTDDYIDLPAGAIPDFTGQPWSYIAVARFHGTPALNTRIVSMKSGATFASIAYWQTGANGYSHYISGVTSPNVTVTQGLRHAFYAGGDGVSEAYHSVDNGAVVTRTGLASISDATAARIGAETGVAGNFADAEVSALLVKDGLFSAAELAQVGTFYGVGL